MKKLTLTLCALVAIVSAASAGVERYSGKDKTMAPPCTEYYGDREFNISAWGAFAFADTHNHTNEYYLLFGDLGGGGGIDVNYFFRRYFGVGIEGFGLFGQGFDGKNTVDRQLIAARLGSSETGSDNTEGVFANFILRYPYPCSHWAPYTWVGIGAVFADDNDQIDLEADRISRSNATGATVTSGSDFDRKIVDNSARLTAQVGLGMEYRFTQHIGLKSDFAYHFVDGRGNNFGMTRLGVNFAF